MVGERTLYREVTVITEDYLGPAAPRFLDRIIENHLNKRPDEITRKDMEALITWVQLSICLITDKQEDINQFIGRLNKLAGQKV